MIERNKKKKSQINIICAHKATEEGDTVSVNDN